MSAATTAVLLASGSQDYKESLGLSLSWMHNSSSMVIWCFLCKCESEDSEAAAGVSSISPHPSVFLSYTSLLCPVTVHCHVPPYRHRCAVTPSTPPPPPPPSSFLHSLRVRTCRLPLIWVAVIQFSGRYKPAQRPTTSSSPHLSLTFSWAL